MKCDCDWSNKNHWGITKVTKSSRLHQCAWYGFAMMLCLLKVARLPASDPKWKWNQGSMESYLVA